MARVSLSFDAWSDGQVGPTSLDIAVVAGKARLPLEAVSNRLKGELVHPSDAVMLTGLRFSSDGRRFIAGDYPGGVVVMWDVTTNKKLTAIETGKGYRGSAEYFYVSPDWQTLFVSREGTRNHEQIQQGEKKLYRWEFDGDVRAWDLETGQLRKTFKHQPAHGVRSMQVAPDASAFVTFGEVPGTYEAQLKVAATLWETATGQRRSLPEGLQSHSQFSPDSRNLAVVAVDENNYAQALKLFDSATGQEKRSIPIADKNVVLWVTGFSPDSRLVVGIYRVFEAVKKWDKWQCWLKIWDCTTGREVASFASSPNTYLNSHFSPDGQTLALVESEGDQTKLILFRVADKQLIKTIVLGSKRKGERLVAMSPVFGPDGKSIAIITQVYPETRGNDEPDVRDVPQPRIHLIDVAAGENRETLIAPPGFAQAACFSPDGRLLATGGHGRVLLWDVTNPRAK